MCLSSAEGVILLNLTEVLYNCYGPEKKPLIFFFFVVNDDS